jgi:hypothetical protein
VGTDRPPLEREKQAEFLFPISVTGVDMSNKIRALLSPPSGTTLKLFTRFTVAA